MNSQTESTQPRLESRRRGFVGNLVFVFENIMPDPFVLSIGITLVVVVLALIFAPKSAPGEVIEAWFTGMFAILGFALQMILILATGFAIADAPVVQRRLRALAARVDTPASAAFLIFPIVGCAAWLNWGLGLVVGAFLAREIARHTRVDFAWLVAGSYSAWSVCNSGLSSSIALSQASPGNALNFVEKLTGHVIPLSQTILAPFVFVPTVLVVVGMMGIFILIHPKPEDVVPFAAPAQTGEQQDPHTRPAGTHSLAARVERSIFGSLFIVALGVYFLVTRWLAGTFELGIETTILIFFLIGLALQRTPIAYADAIRRAARQSGSMLLQYPMYGGIMGVMRHTGLAASISKGIVAVATQTTLPLFSYASSLVITLLIPSAGGHWAVDGPFMVPAAISLNADLPRTVMGIAMAENVSNMLQPFWAVPVVAIAGIRIQRVMGYTAITFAVSLVIYAASLWLIP